MKLISNICYRFFCFFCYILGYISGYVSGSISGDDATSVARRPQKKRQPAPLSRLNWIWCVVGLTIIPLCSLVLNCFGGNTSKLVVAYGDY